MAEQAGVSQTTVQRIWNAHQLKPHLVRTFKLSNDKRFVEKLRDVVALYLNPPEHALVLCVDEKSQIQALDRTQPGLPMKKGRCGTMTHDYKRNGTTTLFAALNMCDGTVISRVTKRHRHQEYLTFLRQLDRETPKGLTLHLIVDNYATHKHEKVQTLVGEAPSIPPSLHPHVVVLAEHGRAVLSGADRQENQARRLPLSRRIDQSPGRLHCRSQPGRNAVHLDQECGGNPGETGATLRRARAPAQ